MGGIRTSEALFEFYRYVPSIPAAVVFIFLFSVVSVLHTYQAVRTCCLIAIPLLIGAYSEIIGYIGRILSSNQSPNYTIGPFLLQSFFTLIAPNFFAAFIYMLFGRILNITGGQSFSLVRPSLLTAFFVGCDIFGMALTGAGAGYMTAGTLDNFYTGEKIVIGGLSAIVVSFGLFIVVALVFDIRLRKSPTPASERCSIDWKKDLWALYAASTLILVRSIIRLIEYCQGNAGWLLVHEWTLYIFDATLMLAVLVIFIVVHPSRVRAALKGGKYSNKMGLRFEEHPESGKAKGVSSQKST